MQLNVLRLKEGKKSGSEELKGNLGFPVDGAPTIYQFADGAYKISSYDADFEEWDSVPSVGVAEGFWVLNASAGNWTRAFSTSE